jgi:hypothetical protein
VELDLVSLVEWTRRQGGDRVQVFTEEIIADGSGTILLENDGDISLLSVTVDGQDVPLGDVAQEGNLLSLADPPQVDAVQRVRYQHTQYTEDEVVEFLADAAETVASDLHSQWQVDGPSVQDADGTIFVSPHGIADATVKRLIVGRAAIAIRRDKANTAADETIVVRDGSTAINTSQAALATERLLRRMTEEYERTLKRALASRFRGRGGLT